MINSKIDRSQVKIVKKGQEEDDVLFWLERMPIERILALETIRQEYNQWKYGNQRGFERVYKIAKRKRG
jgi:hypothetical protein